MEHAVQGYKDRSHIFDISAAITYLPEATQQFVLVYVVIPSQVSTGAKSNILF